MNTENKKFYVTLEYVCTYNAEYNHTHTVPTGFMKFDTAVQFGETLTEMYKDHLTNVANYSVTWR